MATTEAGGIEFYKAPDDKVRPGDVVRLAPAFRALKQRVHVGAEQHSKDVISATLHGKAGGQPIPLQMADGRKDCQLVVPASMTWGLLLTRGCDVDHGTVRQVAAIRPLSVFNEADQEAVILGNHTSVQYLPPAKLGEQDFFGDSFVDFRYVATLHRDLFSQLERPLSLTRDALLSLYFGWTRHTLGPQFQETQPCPSCGKSVPVFELREAVLQPALDY